MAFVDTLSKVSTSQLLGYIRTQHVQNETSKISNSTSRRDSNSVRPLEFQRKHWKIEKLSGYFGTLCEFTSTIPFFRFALLATPPSHRPKNITLSGFISCGAHVPSRWIGDTRCPSVDMYEFSTGMYVISMSTQQSHELASRQPCATINLCP